MAIVKAYWQCAVTDRGALATGGQTAGEVWMPKQKMKARLGDKNQEHCTVYNMIRLAEFLFRHTSEPAYMQYIEYNLYNGIMAQAYYQEYSLTGNKHNHPSTGLLTYFLPMKAGLRKDWSTETDSFFCCHGTMVQANAAWNQGLYYAQEDHLYVCQYFDSEMKAEIGGTQVRIRQAQDRMSGNLLDSSNTAGHHAINDMTTLHENMPAYRKHDFTVSVQGPQLFELNLRIPEWVQAEAQIYVNGELHGATTASEQFYAVRRSWEDGDRVSLLLPLHIQFVPLPDDASMGAFRYGPDVLAGIVDAERILFVDGDDVVSEIELENEREWGSWRYFFKTVQQDPGIELRRIRDIGYEPYQVYFKVKQRQS
jgi:DUF1680 family protein